MCAVVPSAAICTDKTLFTLNISNKNVQTLAARPTRVHFIVFYQYKLQVFIKSRAFGINVGCWIISVGS